MPIGIYQRKGYMNNCKTQGLEPAICYSFEAFKPVIGAWQAYHMVGRIFGISHMTVWRVLKRFPKKEAVGL